MSPFKIKSFRHSRESGNPEYDEIYRFLFQQEYRSYDFRKKFKALSIFGQKPAGFTLIEITVVLFLIILILGLSAVYFSGSLASVRIDSTGREVLATMRYARSMARMNHEKQILTIDLDAKSYGIEGHSSRNIPQEIRIRVLDPFSGEIVNGKYSMIYPASGAVGGGTVILSNNRKELSILTDPVVGSVIKGKDYGNVPVKGF